MPDNALLSASIPYGLVARSFPFKDKVLTGYLNATGVPPGLSFGNPSTELTPNISVCILASDGTTAKVIWGRRDGSVSIVSHLHTMSGTRAPVRIHTSTVDQEHEDAVLDGTWAASGDTFVTAGADGRVKVWTTKPFFRCAWTSERHLRGRETDAIIRVVEDLDNGLVVAASGSGDIIVLSGFDASLSPVDTPQPNIHKFCISTDELSKAHVGLTQTQQSVHILSFLPQVTSSTRLSVLVCRVDSAHFYRCTVDLRSKQVTAKVFGNPAFGLIRCIHPAFSTAEPDFVIVGTQLGFISIYDWDNISPSSDALLGSRHADVFDNSHVTSLAVNSFVIAAGSARGAIMVLDLLTLETLRSIAAPMNSDVGQIELIGEALVARVGGKVLAWSSGHFIPGGKDTLKTKGKGKQQSRGKWFSTFFGSDLRHLRHLTCFAEQVELRNEIAEAKSRLVEESRSFRRSFGPEREQSKKLQTLGLSEREAVEYTLMLSRDEEIQRVQRRTQHVDEQEIIEADESLGRQSGSDPSFSLTSSSLGRYSPPSLSRRSTSGTGLLVPPPTSNVKVQVSPRFHPEPTRAGGLLGSPSDSQSPGSVSFSRSKPGPTSSRATSSKQASTRDSTSPAKQNAWCNPLPGTGSSTSPTGTPGTNWEPEAESISSVEDLELRFALELSLAEAQSRE
jgi:WD40 repeat protein